MTKVTQSAINKKINETQTRKSKFDADPNYDKIKVDGINNYNQSLDGGYYLIDKDGKVTIILDRLDQIIKDNQEIIKQNQELIQIQKESLSYLQAVAINSNRI